MGCPGRTTRDTAIQNPCSGLESACWIWPRSDGVGGILAALVERLRTKGRLQPQQIPNAAMRRLLVIVFGVRAGGKTFDATQVMPAA